MSDPLISRPATLSHVAARAGVSAMTASRVVNGAAGVRPETRRRVEEAVKALSYLPNPAARLLAGVETVRIGLLYGNPSRAYLSEVLVGTIEAAAALGAQLTIERCASAQDVAGAVERLIDRGVAGVLLPPPFSEDGPVHAALAAAGVPPQAIAEIAGPGGVSIDDEAAAYEITRHLLAQGHRRLAHIAGPDDQTASARRRAGFMRAVREIDPPAPAPAVAQGGFDFASGLAAAEALLAAEPRPTAIFAANDDMAAAVISVASRRGLAVPQALSVVGFDDTFLATSVSPTLTTVRQPVARMAYACVERLLGRLRGGDRASDDRAPAVMAHEIVLRDSVAPPPPS